MVDGYCVYYWPANEHYRTAEHFYTSGVHTYQARIPVEPGVVYAVRVGGFSSEGGYGKKSPTTYFVMGEFILISTNHKTCFFFRYYQGGFPVLRTETYYKVCYVYETSLSIAYWK